MPTSQCLFGFPFQSYSKNTKEKWIVFAEWFSALNKSTAACWGCLNGGSQHALPWAISCCLAQSVTVQLCSPFVCSSVCDCNHVVCVLC